MQLSRRRHHTRRGRHTVALLSALAVLSAVAAAASTTAAGAEEQKPAYTLIDLGTLGGPQNYIQNPGAVLNNRGMVALGGADINAPDPHPDNCFNLDCYRDHAAIWQDGHLVDLGAFPGPTSSGLGGMSANGLGAGISTDGTIDPASNIFVFRAALFGHGQVLDLGTFGGVFSWAADVNNRGQVVGSAENKIPDPYAADLGGAFNQGAPPLPGTGQNRAFLWVKGSKQDLGTLGGNDAEAWMINERGQITGASFTTTTANPTTNKPTQHPFLWQYGRMVDLGSMGGTNGLPANLNNAGQVVGAMNLAGDQTHHAFLWHQGKLTDLGTLGGASSDAEWQNQAGDVVGRADTPKSSPACSVGGPLTSNHCPHDAVMWKNGRMIDLGKPTGDVCATATGINAQDQVVGSAGVCGAGGDGFLWQNGTIYNVNDLVIPAAPGWRVTDAFYINDRGEIFAQATINGGDVRAILLKPSCRGDSQSSTTCEAGDRVAAGMHNRPPVAGRLTSVSTPSGTATWLHPLVSRRPG